MSSAGFRIKSRYGLSSSNSAAVYASSVPSENVTSSPNSPSIFTLTILLLFGHGVDSNSTFPLFWNVKHSTRLKIGMTSCKQKRDWL